MDIYNKLNCLLSIHENLDGDMIRVLNSCIFPLQTSNLKGILGLEKVMWIPLHVTRSIWKRNMVIQMTT